MSRADAPRLCCAHNCRETVVCGQLMCKPHWLSLPKPIRDEVWASWRAYQPRAVANLDGMEIARRGMRYMAAVRAAREYLLDADPLTDAMRDEQAAFRDARASTAAPAASEPPSILEAIEAFLRRSGMAPTRFGRDAARDPRIVSDLREGRKISDRVRRRLAHFIASHEREALL